MMRKSRTDGRAKNRELCASAGDEEIVAERDVVWSDARGGPDKERRELDEVLLHGDEVLCTGDER